MNRNADQGYSNFPLFSRRTRPEPSNRSPNPLEALLGQPIRVAEPFQNPYGMQYPTMNPASMVYNPMNSNPYGLNPSNNTELSKSHLSQPGPRRTDASISRDLIQKNYFEPFQPTAERPSNVIERIWRREASLGNGPGKVENGYSRSSSVNTFVPVEKQNLERRLDAIEKSIWPVAGMANVFNRRELPVRKNPVYAVVNTEEVEEREPQNFRAQSDQKRRKNTRTFSTQNLDDYIDQEKLLRSKASSTTKNMNEKSIPIDIEINNLINDILTPATIASTKMSKVKSKDPSHPIKAHKDILEEKMIEDKTALLPVMAGAAVNSISNEPKGLMGLRNIGNTCFMNSILQSLFNAPVFSNYFLKGDYVNEINHKRSQGIAKAFANLLTKVRAHAGPPTYSSESTVMLKRRIEEVNEMFCGYAQHDAQEFLKALLEAINEDLNRVTSKPAYQELKADPTRPLETISDEWYDYMLKRDNSIVTDLFSGQLLSRTVCSHCRNESLAFDNFWDLSLSFTRGLNMIGQCDLLRMLEHFLKEETLDDLFHCEKCKKKRKFKKNFAIWRLPKVLVIHLKRFHYGKFKKEKIRNSVVFPVQNLDLSDFVKDSKDDSVKDSKYTLFAIVNHSGSLDGGHYTAECLNPYNKKWYDFNDSSVKEASIVKEKGSEAEGESPYILFYIKTSCL